MKKIILAMSILVAITSCKKDNDGLCVSNVEDEITLDIHYNKIGCTGNGNIDFEWKFDSEEVFDDFECKPSGIPIPLNFDGIILAQGVKVPYGGVAYSPSIKIKKDTCDKFIDFKFILTTIDTSQLFEHNENVLVLLNGVDSTYTVNFSHEIIPFKD